MFDFLTDFFGFLCGHIVWRCSIGILFVCVVASAFFLTYRRFRRSHSSDKLTDEDKTSMSRLQDECAKLSKQRELLLKKRESLLKELDVLSEKFQGLHLGRNDDKAIGRVFDRQKNFLLQRRHSIEDRLSITERQLVSLKAMEERLLACLELRCCACPAPEVGRLSEMSLMRTDCIEEDDPTGEDCLLDEMLPSHSTGRSATSASARLQSNSLEQNTEYDGSLVLAGKAGTAGEPGTGSDLGVGVVAPATASCGDTVMVQVVVDFIHDLKAAIEKAKELDSTNHAVERGSLPIRDVKNGAELSFQLDAKNLAIADDERIQTHLWEETPFNLQFFASVPQDARLGPVPVRVLVSVSNRPVGRIGFVLNVVETKIATPKRAETIPHVFSEYFVSYSDKDLDRVLPRVQGLRIAERDFHFFFDKLSLHPGERYEPAILDYIDNKADVFLLFWSANAAASEWVEKEWRRALARQGRTGGIPDIVPVPLDKDAPRPPPELSHLHFGDSILSLARGARPAENA